MSLTVRAAQRGDIDHIASWNQAMPWETEQKRLDSAVLARGVPAEFDQPPRGF